MTILNFTAKPSFDTLLSTRHNSLNLIRLFLAMLVLVSHAWIYAGNASELELAGDSLGGWAVAGFFGISGYLVTRSMVRSRGPMEYLKRRALRIFPGYWVCLLATAFIFAPFSFFLERGTISGFFKWSDGPFSYAVGNSLLIINQGGIDQTLQWSRLQLWNPSLWTIAYEFAAYIVIMVVVLGVRIIAAKSDLRWILLGIWILTVFVYIAMPHFISLESFNIFTKFFKLLSSFFAGSLLFLFQKQIPVNGLLAAGFLSVTLFLNAWEPRWMGQLCAPMFTYFLLWASVRLPSMKFVRAEDLSYGLYIYAFPITQLLYQFKIADHVGSTGFLAVLTVAVLAVAALSWFFVEKPALALIRRSTPRVIGGVLEPK